LCLLAYPQNTGKLAEVDIVWGIAFLELQQPQGAHQNHDRMTTILQTVGTKWILGKKSDLGEILPHIDSAVLQ
jgi:hypothetical protein